MTGKEALNELLRLYIGMPFHNVHARDKTLEKMKEYVDNIRKDLNRLEEINNVWHKNEPMESVDINGIHLQELYDYIHRLCEENDKLKKVIEEIKNLPDCDICDANWHKGCICLKRKIEEVFANET